MLLFPCAYIITASFDIATWSIFINEHVLCIYLRVLAYRVVFALRLR